MTRGFHIHGTADRRTLDEDQPPFSFFWMRLYRPPSLLLKKIPRSSSRILSPPPSCLHLLHHPPPPPCAVKTEGVGWARCADSRVQRVRHDLRCEAAANTGGDEGERASMRERARARARARKRNRERGRDQWERQRPMGETESASESAQEKQRERQRPMGETETDGRDRDRGQSAIATMSPARHMAPDPVARANMTTGTKSTQM